jgi:hypothetical protein
MLVSQILSVVIVALLQHMILNCSDCCDARQASVELVSGCHELGNDLISFSAIQRKWLQRELCMLCFAGLMFAPTWLSEPEVLASAKTRNRLGTLLKRRSVKIVKADTGRCTTDAQRHSIELFDH